ncbi:MAG: hypothetical protein JST01_25105 [Cyanobacteria bacterium SZAS TMP-1]|nr:hypothetical protein [Cyanobacteria bacterium SZAS TMP-1]
MSFLPDEHPVRLEKLDDHLKAILKIKIREFVHLNPIFNCIPSIDVENYTRISQPAKEDLPVRRGMLSQLETEEALAAAGRAYFSGFDIECPNKFRLTPARRRHTGRPIS